MSSRSMKSGIEVLDDLVSFFEASPAFISVPCEKIRKTHGPTFKMTTVKAILNLRTDLTKEERAEALRVCTEILDSFKNYNDGKKGGIFSNLELDQNTKVQEQIEEEPGEEHNEDGNETMNFDDFLKEGGLDMMMDGDKKEEDKEEEKEAYNTDPDEKMTGFLYKSSIEVEGQFGNGEEDLFNNFLNGLGGGLKLGFKVFQETIQQKK
mmetsp:Transcript_12756/g.12637  ORF Transcript_12756/g.12637 Transcript_12756/m.12637 type:complete len:208 (+) Transcript_12756:1154-1777(+)